MNFSTKVPIGRGKKQITYNSEIFSLGSCFAVNISDKFSHFKIQNTVNPHGILFHPLAIEKFLTRQDEFRESDIIFNNERWHCFDAHSDLSSASKSELLASLNQRLANSQSRLKRSTHIIITLGTAFVYKHLQSGETIANCHKFPQHHFTKELLSVAEIAQSLARSISVLERINQTAQIIFTISPVRHLKDGFTQNQNSKANLISGLNEVLQANSHLDYFPSYEIMMDELRDYRFYNADMIHPNQIAIDYIWERFSEAYLSDETLKTARIVDEILRAKNHRPFNPNSVAHQNFLEKLDTKIAALQSVHPDIKF